MWTNFADLVFLSENHYGATTATAASAVRAAERFVARAGLVEVDAMKLFTSHNSETWAGVTANCGAPATGSSALRSARTPFLDKLDQDDAFTYVQLLC